ncbi:hypothetical protein AVEN_223927-1 [Araneus ventricosus]|uniref:Uncharacterized protein n=1 Tax=Araneus ventricosus TaxID=182803 RepID=A0A4Y2NP41_ARAVE|nr:hypothetical protein AVEN_223927-1 [Araneus ventricosus]
MSRNYCLCRKIVWCSTCTDLRHVKPVDGNTLYLIWNRNLEKREPSQVSYTSSDHSSEGHQPSNSHPIAWERDVNRTKLKQWKKYDKIISEIGMLKLRCCGNFKNQFLTAYEKNIKD